MKLFRKLRVFALLFAVVALVTGFAMLHVSNTADAKPCDCWCMICMLDPPYWCWEECCTCGPIFP